MTRPIYEPSYARTDRKLGWSADQLFRRPATNPPGVSIYEIKVIEDDVQVPTGDDQFVWEIPEDLDASTVVKVEAFISTAGSGSTEIQIRHSDPCDIGFDLLTTPITIDDGECNSKDAAVQPVVDTNTMAWGDHLHIDVDEAADGAMGLGVIVTLAPSALASVVLAGAVGPQGPPGGIVNWTGEWDSGTTYVTNDAVSHNGSSYVAINGNTNVEPGVDAGWETDWMLLASASPDPVLRGVRVTATGVTVVDNDFPPDIISFSSEDWDTDGFHTTTTRLTVPAGMDGVYAIGSATYWGGGDAAGDRAIYYLLNGSVTSGTRFAGYTGNNDAISTFEIQTLLAAGDYVEIAPYQETGGSLTGCRVNFWLQWLGAV